MSVVEDSRGVLPGFVLLRGESKRETGRGIPKFYTVTLPLSIL